MKKVLLQVFTVVGIAVVGHFIAYKMFNLPQRTEFLLVFIAFLFYPIIRNPVVGIYAVFITGPLIPYFRRLYYLAYARPQIDPLIVLGDSLLAIILLGLFFEFKDRFDEDRRVQPYVRVILIYFFYLLLRTFVLNDKSASEAITLFKNYGPPALFFLVGILYATNISHLKRIWMITFIMGVAAAAYGLKQLYFGYSEAENIWFSSISFSTLFIKGVARPFAFFQAPVAFADYMQIAIVAILMIAEWSENKGRSLIMVFIPLLFYGALITSVRSSWVGILATFLFWYTIIRVKGARPRIVTFIVVIIAYFAYEYLNEAIGGGFGLDTLVGTVARSAPNPEYVDMLVTDRSGALADPFGEHSFLSRMVLWKYLLSVSGNPINMFMGRGVGALKADSLYFTYLAEFGYPGAIFIIWLIISFIRKGFYLIDNAGDRSVAALAKGVTIINIILAIVSITGTHIHYFPGDIYFWFWNGVIVKLAVNAESQRSALQAGAT